MRKLLAVLIFLLASAAAVAQGKATLGVHVADLTSEQSRRLNVTFGAYVVDVLPGSAARQAGIAAGDVITAVGGAPVVGAQMMTELVAKHRPGEAVQIKLLRGGRERTVTVHMGAGGVVAAQPASPYNPSPGAQRNPAPVAPPARGRASGAVRTVESSGGVRMMPRSSGYCHALMPPDWGLVGGADGQTAELHSGDSSLNAGWAVHAVDRAMQAYYGPLYGDPDTSNQALLQMMFKEQVQYTTPPQQVGYFIARQFQSARWVGVLLYHVYPPAYGSSPGSYIISTYMAYVTRNRAQGLPIAAAVMTSIRCTAMPHTSGGGSRSGSGGGESGDLDTYNAQLGTQYFHSPTTGENFLVNRADSWNDNGPDGPGVYRQTPNGPEKLAPGMN